MSAKQKMGVGFQACIGVACLLVIAAIAAKAGDSSQETEVKRRKRDAISLCRQERSQESLTTDKQSIIAGACEKMESEFVRDYGVSPN